MKHFFLMIATALSAASLFCLVFAALNQLMYRSTRDAKPEYYDRLHRNVVIFAALGIMIAALAAACFFIRSRF